MVRVLELFAGVGAASKALTNLGIGHEIVDAVENDKYAIKSFNAIHNTNFEPQDITKWDKDIECDLIMHGSPCQDFSIAGLGKGGDKNSGTRSSLVYETLRIVKKLRPKYVVWENVKNLLSAKHRHNFDAYLEAMEELGYKNYYQVLNAKHYGVPQNRERVFTVSILDGGGYLFPEPIPLEKKLKDILEKEVDKRYYLSDKAVVGYLLHSSRHKKRGNGFRFEPTNGDVVAHTVSTKAGQRTTDNYISIIDPQGRKNKICHPKDYVPTLRAQMHGNPPQAIMIDDTYGYEQSPREYTEISPTLRSGRQGLKIKTANKTGYDLATDGGGIDLAYPKSTTRRGRVGHGVSKTLPTSDSQGVLDGYRIRKLTPKECWRLMGFDDASFERVEKVNSNTQLYKQAGNSIVVDVLMAIFRSLLDA